MTDFYDVASGYSYHHSHKHLSYVLVIEVMRSDELQTFEHESFDDVRSNNAQLIGQFQKHVLTSSPQIGDEGYKKDFKGRRYRNVAVENESFKDEYVADESLVVPRYLIIKKNKN